MRQELERMRRIVVGQLTVIDRSIPRRLRLGCIGCLPTVGVAGLVLALLGTALQAECSARIPLTNSNLSATAAMGDKEATRALVPAYLSDKIASPNDPANSTHTLTLGPIDWLWLADLGVQEDSPNIFRAKIEIARR